VAWYATVRSCYCTVCSFQRSAQASFARWLRTLAAHGSWSCVCQDARRPDAGGHWEVTRGPGGLAQCKLGQGAEQGPGLGLAFCSAGGSRVWAQPAPFPWCWWPLGGDMEPWARAMTRGSAAGPGPVFCRFVAWSLGGRRWKSTGCD